MCRNSHVEALRLHDAGTFVVNHAGSPGKLCSGRAGAGSSRNRCVATGSAPRPRGAFVATHSVQLGGRSCNAASRLTRLIISNAGRAAKRSSSGVLVAGSSRGSMGRVQTAWHSLWHSRRNSQSPFICRGNRCLYGAHSRPEFAVWQPRVWLPDESYGQVLLCAAQWDHKVESRGFVALGSTSWAQGSGKFVILGPIIAWEAGGTSRHRACSESITAIADDKSC